MSEYTLTFPEAMQALIDGKTIEEKSRLGYLYQYRKVVYDYTILIERRYSSVEFQNEYWTEWESMDFTFGGFHLEQKFRTIENQTMTKTTYKLVETKSFYHVIEICDGIKTYFDTCRKEDFSKEDAEEFCERLNQRGNNENA